MFNVHVLHRGLVVTVCTYGLFFKKETVCVSAHFKQFEDFSSLSDTSPLDAEFRIPDNAAAVH